MSERRGGCRVYVGNLCWRVQWQELKDFCRAAGSVNYADVMKDANGRSKGYGIVEYATREEAQTAIETLHNKELEGREALVKEDREDVSGRRVFVRNLSWETSWQKLKDHMRSAGGVSYADVIRDERNRSKGWGIVEFETEEEAQKAITDLNETTLDGRKIHVREDKESRDFSRNANRGGSYGPCKLYVGNLAFETTWQKLKDTVRSYGKVSYVDIPQNEDGHSKGWGTVEFENPSAAQRAVRGLNGTMLDGRRINVREFREEGGGGYGGGYGGYNNGMYNPRGYGGYNYGGYEEYDRYDYDRTAYAPRGGYGGRGGGGGYGRGGPALPRSRARPNYRDEGYGGGGRGGGRRHRDYDRGDRTSGGKANVARRVYVGNLSWNVSWQQLKDIFNERVGSVKYCNVLQEHDGRSKGCGIVEFEDHEDAIKAIDIMHDEEIEGRAIFVREDREDRDLTNGRR